MNDTAEEVKDDGAQPPRLSRMYQFLWVHAKGRRWVLMFAYALLGLAEVSLLAVPWLIGQAINTLQFQGLPGLREAGWLLLGVVGVTAASWVFHFPGRILERNVALHVRRSWTHELLRRLVHAPLSWHQQLGSTEISQRVAQSSAGLYGFADSQYLYVQNAIRLFGPFIALSLMSIWIGMIAVVGYGLLMLASVGIDRILVAMNVRSNGVERAYQTTWVDLMSNVLTLKALRRAKGASSMVDKGLSKMDALIRPIVLLNEGKWAMVDIGAIALTCGLVALYAAMSAYGVGGVAASTSVALGSLYMVYEYSRRAEDVVAQMASDFGVMATHLADHHSGQLILSAPQEASLPELKPTSWKTLSLQGADMGVPRMPVPTAWSVTLEAGQRYALVGASGTGKSTFLRMLAGIEQPIGGSLSLDGRTVPFETMRSEATLVSQEAQLFTGTLRENLCDEPLSQDNQQRLNEALIAASAHELLQRSALGWDTPMAEDGRDWSGGQRQRLALARGLFAAQGSSLVLLDEPTSALDARQAQKVLEQSLLIVQPACTVVAIHHFELLDQFDQLIVLEAGHIVDTGPVEQVLLRCAAMHRLMRSQQETAGGFPIIPSLHGQSLTSLH